MRLITLMQRNGEGPRTQVHVNPEHISKVTFIDTHEVAALDLSTGASITVENPCFDGAAFLALLQGYDPDRKPPTLETRDQVAP